MKQRLHQTILSFALLTSAGHAQVTATYIGPTNGGWNTPANWDINQVPINSGTNLFNAILPNRIVNFDLAPGFYQLTAINLQNGGELRIGGGRHLDITGVAVIGGYINASGAGARFSALSEFVSFAPNSAPRLNAEGGAVIEIAAPNFGFNSGSGNVIRAFGTDSRVDLSNLSTLTVSSTSTSAKDIVADNGGIIDLSNLTALTGPSSGGNLRLIIQANSDIILSRLRTTNNFVLFRPFVSLYTLPDLQTANGTTFEVISGNTVSLPSLLTHQRGKIDVQTSGTINMPSLTTMDGVEVVIQNGGTIAAPQLRTFINSTVELNPTRFFNTPLFTNINGSRISVRDGLSYAVAATTYTFSSGSGTLFLASGANTYLDLRSLTSVSVSSTSTGFKDITAENGGVVDLSNVVTVTGPGSGGDLRIFVRPNSDIRFNRLRTLTGRSVWVVSTNFTLPSLESAGNAIFEPQIFARIHMPALTALNQCELRIQDGGTIEAPQLRTFTNSFMELNPTRFLIAPAFTNIDGSRIHLTGGRAYAVAAPSYTFSSGSGILFRAKDADTYLDLRSLENLTVSSTSTSSKDIIAESSGVIDLSNVTTITGPNSGGDLRIILRDGGVIRFGTVATQRRVQFSARDTQTTLRFTGSFTLNSPSRILLQFVPTMEMWGNFRFNNTAEAEVNLADGIVWMNGNGVQRLEVGGEDIGRPSGSIPANFQMGQLIIGDVDRPTRVVLEDEINNGNRTGGRREALYMQGFPSEDGLRIRPSSVLVLNGIQAYAVVNNEWVHLNALLGNRRSIRYDQGYIVRDEGVTNLPDVNDDGCVDDADLLAVLFNFGSDDADADVNFDGVVDDADLLAVLFNFGAGSGGC